MNFKYKYYLITLKDEKVTIYHQIEKRTDEYTYKYLRKMLHHSSLNQLYFNGHNLEVARYVYFYCLPYENYLKELEYRNYT